MRYKDFSFQLILRTSGLLISVVSVGEVFYYIRDKNLIFIPFFLILLIGIQITGIIFLVKRVNREITEVFKRIKKGNYFPSLPAGKYADSFSDLFYTINDLFLSIQQSETQKEAHNIFTEMLVSLIPVGVILLESDDRIRLINNSALEILGLPRITKWAEIQKNLPGFAGCVDEMANSGTGLHKIESKGLVFQLSVNVSSIILLGELNRIITFHDIKTSIEKTEIEAWSKLFRVIRHEILNSVTPISSLAETMQLILKPVSGIKNDLSALSQKDVKDIMECANAIKLRSDGLFSFVNLYRDISKLPVPVKEKISLSELISSVSTLIKPQLEQKGVSLIIEIPGADAWIDADFGMMQQVLINLINNSLYALEDRADPLIRVSAKSSGKKLLINVYDNGPGIPEDLLGDIFVPFFTTRKDGSGLGLSLVKQIIISHGGNISVDAVMNEYTKFVIEMPFNDV